MLLEKIKKFWKAGLVETIKDTFMPFGSKKEKKKIYAERALHEIERFITEIGG